MNEITVSELNDVSGGWVKGIIINIVSAIIYDVTRNADYSGGQTNTNTDPMGNMS